jgi:hypothetical protein
MANRFWVGGSATWDATAGSKWAATSGGAGGASLPAAADDVFLDASSGVGTITIGTTGAVCRSLDCTGFTGTLAEAASSALSVGNASGGAFKLVAGMTFTASSGAVINFVSTSNNAGAGWPITSAGKVTGPLNFNGLGGKWVLQDALTTTSSGGSGVLLTAGALDTNSQTCTWGTFGSNFTSVRGLTFGTSTVNLTAASGSTLNINATNLTASLASSTVVVSGTFPNFAHTGSVTYGTVQFTGLGGGAPTGTINGGPTFANLSLANVSGSTSVSINANITVTGNLTITGASPAGQRILLYSAATGTVRTVSAASVTLSNTDFRDITAAGAATPFSGSSIGDGWGNSNITFTPPVSLYWVGGTGGWNNPARWSTSSGGAGGATVPLPHDNVFIDGNSGTGTVTMNIISPGKNIDFTGYTGTFTTNSAQMYVNGSWTIGAGTTYTAGNVGPQFMGRASHTINTNGQNPGNSYNWSCPGGTYTLLSDITYPGSTGGCILTAGTIDLNGFTLTTGTFTSTNAVTRQLTLGSGGITLTNSGAIWNITGAGMTIVPGSSTVSITDPTSSFKTFFGNGLTYNNVTISSSSGGVTITGANSFNTLTVGPGTPLTMPSSTVNTFNNFNVNGTSNAYLYLPGKGGNYVSTPDSPALSITGDITIDVKVALDAWTGLAEVLVRKMASTTIRSYGMDISSSGRPILYTSPDGSTLLTDTATAATGFANGSVGWVRGSMQVNDGSGNRVVKFYTSSDGLIWTQLGSTVTVSSGAISIFQTASALEVGSTFMGTSTNAAGKFYEVKVYNSYLEAAAGTPVFDADFTAKAFGANSFTESSANAATVSITGTVAQVGDGRVALLSSTPSTAATLSKSSGSVNVNYLTIQDSTAIGGAGWYAGANSVNVSNNTGWQFMAMPGVTASRLATLGVG